MRLIEEPPFENYTVYRVWHKKEERFFAQLINRLDKSRTTISYAKYNLSIKLGRILTRDEQVDHIDNNKLNDEVENLQILTREENSQKWIDSSDRIRQKMIKLTCSFCGVVFERQERQVKYKNNINDFCSRDHQYKFLRV